VRDSSKQSVLFPSMLSKPLEVHFDAPDTTSDGGAVLVKAVDDKLGLTGYMLSQLVDDRQPGKVVHSFTDMFRQRVYGLACGYADVNDVARIGRDPLHKSLLGRNAVTDADLASQPTLSRFENILVPKDLYWMSPPVATSNSPTCGRVKLLHPAVGGRIADATRWVRVWQGVRPPA